MTSRLIRELFLSHLSNGVLEIQGDAAAVPVEGGRIAVSTDSFVVQPLEFPGGDIGSLSVHGTLNDVALMGARPLYLTAGFILEEGLELERLDRIVASMARAAKEAGVPVICGDTKVVERGKADGLFINTTGIGLLDPEFAPRPQSVRPGDAILVSGPIGRHGIAIMAVREGLEFEADVTSDAATLYPLVLLLREAVGPGVHALRDPTRGGLASALNEIAGDAAVGFELLEDSLPIPGPVTAACEILGFDPLYVANEGILLAFVAPEHAERSLEVLRTHPLGRAAAIIGVATDTRPGMVSLRTAIGSSRVVDMLPGDQLPRICQWTPGGEPCPPALACYRSGRLTLELSVANLTSCP